jgi:hypothetical protein
MRIVGYRWRRSDGTEVMLDPAEVDAVIVYDSACQQNLGPDTLGAFTSTHLHECIREQGHRSRVHRCVCGTDWYDADDDNLHAPIKGNVEVRQP